MANKHKKRRKKALREQQRQQTEAAKHKRKQLRHNTAANQAKHRPDWQPLQPNEVGEVGDQRIMPRDEQDRRQTTLAASTQLFNADFDDTLWRDIADETPFELGMVVEVSRGLCRATVNGHTIVCDIRGILTAEGSGFTNIVAVGDRVLVRPLATDRGLVEDVLPRRSGVARADPFNRYLKQIFAANVDQLLIVASWREPRIWLEMIDEYLIGATRNNTHAIVCLNKVDLAKDIADCEAAVSFYAQQGYPIMLTSAATGYGVEVLRKALIGKTTVLAGLSGVGKSSLLTAVSPGLNLRTQSISYKRHEGRHTTTQAIMMPLNSHGYIIDTPGIRGLGVQGLDPYELVHFYPEIEAAEIDCRFSDCNHQHEPGCAVKKAVAAGTILPWRLKNYHALLAKLEEEDGF